MGQGIVSVDTQGTRSLRVTFSGQDPARRRQLVDALKVDFRTARYERSARAWVVPKSAHELLWRWCHAWQFDRVEWDAQDTPEYEQTPNQRQAEHERRARHTRDQQARDQHRRQDSEQRARAEREQQRRQETGLPTGDALARAYGMFHLRPSAPLWAAEAVYRESTKRYHPDRGGTHEQMTAINIAIALIRKART